MTPPGAAEQVRLWIDDGQVPEPGLAPEALLALGWALKELGYAAWSTEPQRAARAAEALQHLMRQAAPGSAAAAEIGALADWTGGIAELTRGNMADALGRFDRAGAAFTALGAAGAAAQTQVPKIMALSMLGRHAEATACAEHTLQAFIAQGDRHAAGRVSLNLGSLHLRHDEYAAAARHYRDAAVLFARVGDTEHSVMADIGGADALSALGDGDEALRLYQRARMRAATHGFPVLSALVDESVALLDLSAGRYHEALAGFECARDRYEQLAMPQHLAIAEKQLADAYLALRLLPEALALYEPALLRFQALQMPDDQAWTLAQRGRAELLQGHPQAAGRSFDQAAQLFAAQGTTVGQAAIALARTELALAQGDAGLALDSAAAAARGFADAGLLHGQVRSTLLQARALLQQGHAAAARVHFDATLAQARAHQWLTLQVHALTGQGQAALAAAEPIEARGAFEAAVELSEDQRRALPGEDLRSAFLSDHLPAYEGLLALALQAHDDAPGPQRAADVLAQLERFRARALGERLAWGRAPQDEPDDAGPDAGDDATRHRLNWLYRRASRLLEDGDTSPQLDEEIRRTERTLLEQARRRRLARRTVPRPGLAADTVPAPSADDRLQQLKAALAPQDALVEYGVSGDELFALVLTREQLVLQRRLASWTEVHQAVRQARFQIETLRHGSAAVAGHLDRLNARVQARLGRLHALIWAALAPRVAACERVLVVAPGMLGQVPFAALHDGVVPLVQRHALAMAASADVALHGLQRPAVAARTVLALGESSRLQHAAAEARGVAALFDQARTLVGPEASLDALFRHAGEHDIVHLACHAQFRSDNPMFSALQLADGALTVERVETLRLRRGIVVLSACETGLAEGGTGDEMVGLVRAFLVAGTARVLASLWPVEDAVTARFMDLFYRALPGGGSPAAALQAAQQALRAEHPHPAHWAAFSLHGGW